MTQRNVAIELLSLLAVMTLSLVFDATVNPRPAPLWPWRRRQVHLLVVVGLFGLFLAGSGNAFVAGLLTIALIALLAIVSNAKHRMLGEPLLFSDLALFAALFRHPRFYFTAISVGQRVALLIAPFVLLIALARLFVAHVEPHLVGIGLFVASAILLAVTLGAMLRRGAASYPDTEADVRQHGLISTLLLYWLRWRDSTDPRTCPTLASCSFGPNGPPELVVIVQCESFADPEELTGDAGLALAGLGAARELAWQWGNLAVSGFGAYTMRTEYGVLFGRSEEELGFRRYDPFLTAHGETSYAMPARLRGCGYRSLFVHPHDMRFYGRDQLMPAIGFHALIGEDRFPPVPVGSRYVGDDTLGDALVDIADESVGPTLIYAVTMENHGPWSKDRLTGAPGGIASYMRHLRSSDAMLSGLIDRLRGRERSTLLVFFGDHRPSIPGVTEPGGPRHTPYVMLRIAASGEILTGANQRIDLTPDQLHHAILDCVRQGRTEEPVTPTEA